MCIVCTIHVWCAFCHTIIKGYLLTYLRDCAVTDALSDAASTPVLLYLGDRTPATV